MAANDDGRGVAASNAPLGASSAEAEASARRGSAPANAPLSTRGYHSELELVDLSTFSTDSMPQETSGAGDKGAPAPPSALPPLAGDEARVSDQGASPLARTGASGSSPALPPLMVKSGTSDEPDQGHAAERDGSRGSGAARAVDAREELAGASDEDEEDDELVFQGSSLFILSSRSPLRRRMFAIMSSKRFEIASVFIILAYCVVLALQQPLQPVDSEWNWTLTLIGLGFLAIFAVEVLFKIATLGLALHPGSYLRDGWNVFDLFVVLTGVVEFISATPGLSPLRAVRVLRPLRTISGIPALRSLATALIAAVPLIADVLALILFLIVLFGVFGVQLWSGVLRQRCVDADTFLLAEDTLRPCSLTPFGRQCADGLVCLDVAENPNFGVTSFDHMGAASLVILQGLTREGWADVMYDLMDGYAESSSIYFIVLIGIGGFLVMNLLLAVLVANFTRSDIVEHTSRSGVLITNREAKERMAKADAHSTAFIRAILSTKSAAPSAMATAAPTPQQMPSVPPSPRAQRRPRSPSSTSPARSPRTTTGRSTLGGGGDAEIRDGSQLARQREPSTADLAAAALTAAMATDEQLRRRAKPARDENALGPSVSFKDAAAPPPPVRQRSRFLSKMMLIDGYVPPTATWRRHLFNVVTNPRFDYVVLALVVTNTVLLGIEHHDMNEDLVVALDIANLVLAAIFLLELLVKNVAYGPRQYFSRSWNLLDATIVAIAALELIFLDSSAFLALRTLRLLRLLRVITTWRSIRRILGVLFTTMTQVASAVFLVIVFLFVFSVLGMGLFGGEFFFADGTYPRHNFDSLPTATLTVFQLLTLEDWYSVMYDAVRATSWLATIYFVLVLLVGRYLLLNLFSAILLQAFAGQTSRALAHARANAGGRPAGGPSAPGEHRGHMPSGAGANQVPVVSAAGSASTTQDRDTVLPASRSRAPSSSSSASSSAAADGGSEWTSDGDGDGDGDGGHMDGRLHTRGSRAHSIDTQSPAHAPLGASPLAMPNHARHSLDGLPVSVRAKLNRVKDLIGRRRRGSVALWTHADLRPEDANRSSILLDDSESEVSDVDIEDLLDDEAAETKLVRELERQGDEIPGEKALGLFSATNPVRLAAWRIVRSRWLELTVLVLILINCVAVALFHPDLVTQDPPSTRYRVLRVLFITFNALFWLEAIVRILASGFVMHPFAYLRDPWNAGDFAVLILSSFDLVVDTGAVQLFQSLRAFRILRSIRVLSMLGRRGPTMGAYVKNLSMLLDTFRKALPALFNLGLFYIFFFTVFGIMGIHFFAGKFYSCTDASVYLRTSCTGLFVTDDGLIAEREWVNADLHFDNIFQSMITLFVVMSLEGWVQVSNMGIDATGVDTAPERDNNRGYALFFVVNIAGAVFLKSMVVGVLTFHFKRQLEILSGGLMLNPRQREWIDVQKWVIEERPRESVSPGRHPLRRACQALVFHRHYATAALLLDCLNVIMLMLHHYDEPQVVEDVIFYGSIAFTTLFALEIVVKLIAYQPRHFARVGWNLFDVVIVAGSIVGLALGVGTGAFFRLFRVTRVVKVMRSAHGLQRVVSALITSLSSLTTIGSMLIICVHVFAVLGVFLFHDVTSGDAIDDVWFNFHTYPVAALSLFRLASGEQWNVAMRDMVAATGPAARLFFTAYNVLVSAVLLNAFVAIVTSAFVYKISTDDFRVSKGDMRAAARAFEAIQRKSESWSYYLQTPQVVPFLRRLPPSLRHDLVLTGDDMVILLRVLLTLNLSPHGDEGFHYHDIVASLVGHAYAIQLPPNHRALSTLESLAMGAFPERQREPPAPKLDAIEAGGYSIVHLYAAMAIQRFFRNAMRARDRRKRGRAPTMSASAATASP